MSENKFGLLRKVLRALGLSQQSADDVVDFIVDLLDGESKESGRSVEFPYHLRDHFLSPAELNFYRVLTTAVDGQVIICTKVNLSDLFYVPKADPSRYRIYTNKIDRKHVDFLLCDPKTLQPLVGMELDDKSHQRKDRQERDIFVDGVFRAAGLALVHVPVRRAYNIDDILDLLDPYLYVQPNVQTRIPQPVSIAVDPLTPVCPKCGGDMVLRTAKKGANAGQQFWGCANYPKCRSMLSV